MVSFDSSINEVELSRNGLSFYNPTFAIDQKDQQMSHDCLDGNKVDETCDLKTHSQYPIHF